ncbi:EF-hand domain-containing protein [Ramlibacter tataouinensis]|uniref:EF-hand domain-containing protein n=1 Tax=Ramlibacter tataouinensis (strain ATCC BAA-407 / DSM 14655 / LMG 21543 / TTB310) TaxID=365046 RepID=F5Y362_RAMTT|nr:EF-hand domain-containing protein [Ramlibacter tataouinensis]AEG91149.1 Conserved hypothetical protein [Ramlibacter tataouinensis TTB310]
MRPTSSSTTARRGPLPSSKARNVALGSVLLVGAALVLTAAHAQTPGSTPAATASARAAAEDPAPRMRLSSSQVQQAFRHIDSNHDGSLTRTEMGVYPRIQRHFERIDTNRDGLLSPAEFEEALQQAS